MRLSSRSAASSNPEEIEKRYPRIHQGRTRAHAMRNSSATRSRKPIWKSYSDYGQKPVRSLRRLLPMPGSKTRTSRTPDTGQLLNREFAQPGIDQDREARRDCQPKGLPQRSRQVLAAVGGPRTAARTRPGPAMKRFARVIEKRIFSQVEDLLPVYLVRLKKGRRDRKRSTANLSSAWSGAVYTERQVSPARRMVHAGENKPAEEADARVAMHIVDRRLKSGQQEPRETASVSFASCQGVGSGCRQEILAGPRHQGCPGRRRGQPSPLDGMNETAPFRRERRQPATWCFPVTRSSSKATYFLVSGEGSGRGSDPGEGDGEDAFRFVLSRDEFVDLFLDDLELPDLAKRKLAEAESEGLRRAGYATSGSPANISVSRTVRLALARRVALRRPRPETIAET